MFGYARDASMAFSAAANAAEASFMASVATAAARRSGGLRRGAAARVALAGRSAGPRSRVAPPCPPLKTRCSIVTFATEEAHDGRHQEAAAGRPQRGRREQGGGRAAPPGRHRLRGAHGHAAEGRRGRARRGKLPRRVRAGRGGGPRGRPAERSGREPTTAADGYSSYSRSVERSGPFHSSWRVRGRIPNALSKSSLPLSTAARWPVSRGSDVPSWW